MLKKKFLSFAIVGLTGLAMFSRCITRANAETLYLNATYADGIRTLSEYGYPNPFLLSDEQVFDLAPGQVDVTVMDFDISGIPQNSTISSATLGFLGENIDPNTIRTIGVYTFYGESVVQPSDFYAGSFATTFLSSYAAGQFTNETVDVTAAVQSAVNASEQLLDLKLAGLDEGTRVFLEGPYELSIAYTVPEPRVFTILTCGLVLASAWRRRAFLRFHKTPPNNALERTATAP